MKKLLILSTGAIILIATVNAQTSIISIKNDEVSLKRQESEIKKEKREDKKELKKLIGKDVSNRSKQAFRSDFGNIPVNKWERTANYDEATFTKDGQVITAYYDADSKLVGTTSNKTFADIPAAGQKYINAKYADYSKINVVLFDDNEFNETDMIMYGNQFDDADNYFVELKKGDKDIILQVNMSGDVIFFKELK